MVLKNAPDGKDRRPNGEEEDLSLLDRFLEYKAFIGVALIVLVIAALAIVIIRGVAASKEDSAWFQSEKLRQNASQALAAFQFLGAERKDAVLEALKELEAQADEYAGSSVHPILLYYQARLYHCLDRLEDAQKTIERLQSLYPKNALTNPDYTVPGDVPLARLESDELQARMAFESKMGKPFSKRPKPKEGLSATIKVKDFGDIKLGFFPDVAPKHVANFISLAKEGFFNGTTFHRITTFCIQGGDPNSRDDDPKNDGQGGPGWDVEKEIRFNPALHTKGTVSAASSSTSGPDSGSQFFICTTDMPSLDGNYTPYGEVISGMDVVKKIAQQKTQGDNKDGIPTDRPVKKIVIESVVVEGDFTLPEREMPGYLERKKKAEEKKK